MIPYKQLSLAEIFTDCQEKLDNDKPAFLSLLETHIDIDEIIPISFRNHFYASTGRTRKYSLQAFLWALIIQRIFSIPTDQLLLVFLAYSKPLRDFCGFDKVPDASKITRFKQDFLDDLQSVFEHLVDLTEPICQAIDSAKADMTIFDSSGIEAFVTENNPKYANRIIKQLKAYAKSKGYDKSYDPYKAAYGAMPSHASVSSDTFWSPQTTHYNLQLFQEKSTIASQRHDHASFPAFYQLNAWLLIAANITSASITFLSI